MMPDGDEVGQLSIFPEVNFLNQSRLDGKSRTGENMPRPRRKSSSLGSDLRGDTGASALSTLERRPTTPLSPLTSPPTTPTPESQNSPPQRSAHTKAPRHSKRRKARTYFKRWKNFTFRHTWVNPLVIILVILSAYIVNPTPTNPVHSAIFLSYPLDPSDPLIPTHARLDPNVPTHYGKGPLDLVFVAFYTVVLSFTREFLMQRLIRPLALWNNIRSRVKQNRFMEQVYTAMYFSIFGPFGLYVMSRTPVWYFNTTGMFEGFPHRSHEGLFKLYYLLEASYWAQQAIVLCLLLEKPRKDFKELVGHHIVTLALIGLSYRFHFTYMGLAVYITHDISDFFLATSKICSYLESSITAPYFSFFVGVWVYCRHYLNLAVLYATLTEFRTVGPFELDWTTQQYKCWISQYITFALLASLQSINLLWLFFILRIAYNIAFQISQSDVREDEEKDTDIEEESTKDAKQLQGTNGHTIEGQMPGDQTSEEVVMEKKKEK